MVMSSMTRIFKSMLLPNNCVCVFLTYTIADFRPASFDQKNGPSFLRNSLEKTHFGHERIPAKSPSGQDRYFRRLPDSRGEKVRKSLDLLFGFLIGWNRLD